MKKTAKAIVKSSLAYYMIMSPSKRYDAVRTVERNIKRPLNWSPHNGITRDEYIEASRVFLYIVNRRADIIEYLDAVVFNARLRDRERKEYEALKARVKSNKS